VFRGRSRSDEQHEHRESSERHACAAPLLCGNSCTRSGAAGQGWRQSGAHALWLHGMVNGARTGNHAGAALAVRDPWHIHLP